MTCARSLLALASTRLARGTAATAYGQIVQIVIQLGTIPILTQAWGIEGYGIWVMLFTVPQLLAMGDFGLITTGGNEMTAAIARGDAHAAARTYGALRWILLLLSIAIAAIAALFLSILPDSQSRALETFANDHGIAVCAALLIYGLLGLGNLATMAAFRAADAFASSNFLFQTIGLFEAIVALAVALLGYGPYEVALTYLSGRAIGTALMTLALRRYIPWLHKSGWAFDIAPLRPLVSSALAALMLPAAYAIALQGSVLAIGAAVGPGAVSAFAITRTLSRSALQFAFAFNLASMPRYTVAAALSDHHRQKQLVAVNLLAMIGLLLPAAVLLIALGRPFVAWWTGGVVVPSMALVILLVGTMLLNGAWVPISNFILATNRHSGYAYFFLGTMTLMILAGYVLTLSFGAAGMAGACLAGEAIMVAWVWRLAYRMKVVEPASLIRMTKDGFDKILRR